MTVGDRAEQGEVSRAAAPAGYLPGDAGYRRVVVALFAAGVATFALLYSTQAIRPELADRFRVTPEAATLTVSLATLGLGVALLVAGAASDVMGRTRLIHWSVTAAAVVGLVCAAAPSWTALLVLRLLQGVVLAGLPAVATAYLREELHPSSQGRAAGLYIGGTALGGMSGRLLTGAVAELAGWRWALVAAGLLGLLCAAVVRALLPASRGFVAATADWRGVLQRLRRALSDPALLALYAVGGCAMGALVGVFNTLGFRLQAAPYGLGLGAASLVFLVYPVGSVTSTVAGRLADRVGRRAVLPVGAVVAVVGVLMTLAAPLTLVVLGTAVMTGGFFAVHGVASGWVPARAHAGGVASGQAPSLYLFTYYLGSSVFGSLAGRAWTDGGWAAVVALTTSLFVVTAVLALVLRRTPTLLPSADVDERGMAR
ncbi:MAG: MFS transporter [Actinomycetes bacterium]